ncbi:MAG: alpha/beta hydrolase [Rhodospirillaceae bacterium]|nr:alpha/beta hydrolase [Rhodospirillaceae bacterium]
MVQQLDRPRPGADVAARRLYPPADAGGEREGLARADDAPEALTLRVHYREQGAGPPLVLLHSAGTGASQWRGVAGRLEGRRRLLMPNLRGYGRTPPPDPAAPPLDEEIAVVREMATLAGAPAHLVGHSLGALVALHHALRHPETVAGLTLIEPVIVGILHADRAGGGDAAQIRAVRSLDEIGAMIAAFRDAIAAGDTAAAMRAFTEYWEGAGAWDAIPAAARLPFFARAEKMAADVDLAWADRTGRAAFAALACPAQVLSAERTTPAARDMARRIADAIPGAAFATIPDAGHMAPVTRPATVGDLLLAFEGRATGHVSGMAGPTGA